MNTQALPHMTPQEIVDAATSVRERMLAYVRDRTRMQDEAIKTERARIRAVCSHSTGHVFGMQPNPYGADFRACVYCGAEPSGVAARMAPEDVPNSDV